MCQLESTLTHELETILLSLYNMQEKPENTGRIRNNGTFRVDSKQMQAVDEKQWSGLMQFILKGSLNYSYCTSSSA